MEHISETISGLNLEKPVPGTKRQKSPLPQCKKCVDIGWLQGSKGYYRCECRVKLLQKKVLGGRFIDCTLDNYIPKNESQRKVKEVLSKNQDKSYFIYGDYRAGKTHLLSALYSRSLIDCRRDNCVFVTDKDLKKALHQKETAFKENLEYNLPPVSVEEIRSGRLKELFWDDIGKVKVSEFVRQELFALVDEIYRQGTRLVISSNFNLDELGVDDMLGGSIVRRIEDICELLELIL